MAVHGILPVIVSSYTNVLLALAMAWCALCMYLERFMNAFRLMWPNMIIDMHYVHPEARIVVPQYAPMFPMFASWSRHFTYGFTHRPLDTGIYVFRVWQKREACYATYAVSPAHFMAALQIKSLHDAWAFSEAAIIVFLSAYVEAHKEDIDIMDITVDNNPALAELKPIIKSMSLPLNWRARTLAIWLAFVRWERRLGAPSYEHKKSAHVVIVDDDLNEKTYIDEEVVCPYKKNE